MRSMERRLDHLEAKIPVPPCGHAMAYLIDPTEKEVEDVRKELNACPQCRGSQPFVVFHNYGKDKEEPQPEVQGFTFEVETEPEAEESKPEIRTRFLTF